MTLKNIGVFIDATSEGEKLADFAAILAHQNSGGPASSVFANSRNQFFREINGRDLQRRRRDRHEAADALRHAAFGVLAP
jgi:hypothetical protein